MKTTHPNLILVLDVAGGEVNVLHRIGAKYIRSISIEEACREYPEYEFDKGIWDSGICTYFADSVDQALTRMSKNKGSLFTGSVPEDSFEAQAVYVIRSLLERVRKLEEWQHPAFQRSKSGTAVAMVSAAAVEALAAQSKGKETK